MKPYIYHGEHFRRYVYNYWPEHYTRNSSLRFSRNSFRISWKSWRNLFRVLFIQCSLRCDTRIERVNMYCELPILLNTSLKLMCDYMFMQTLLTQYNHYVVFLCFIISQSVISHKKKYHGTLPMYHGTLTMYHVAFSYGISIYCMTSSMCCSYEISNTHTIGS